MAAGTLVQGSLGFGTNLVAAPILAVIDPQLVPVPVILASLVFNVLLARRDRGEVPWQVIRRPLMGLVPASVLGAAAVAMVSQRGLGILFGILVLVAVALSVSGRHPSMSPSHLLTAGAASGFMGTTTGIGGPPVVSFLTLMAFGQVAWADFGRAAVLVPGGLLGFFVSRHTAHRLDHGYVRHGVLAVSGLSAVIVLTRALLA
jgi:uncharacterized membrane protein YfcA